MSAFSTKRVRQKDLSAQDISLKVEDLLKLTEASPFREAIIETLSVEDILSETVLISGINALAEAVDSESKKFLKFDVRLSFEDLEFFHLHDDNKIQFVFKNLAEVSFPNQTSDLVQSQVIETSSITAEPIYSAQNALFGKLFGFDKYANQLMGSGLSPVVLANLTMLNDIYREQGKALPKQEYRFRLLREEATGEYFFRALISAVRYQDYNIGVSVFIALVSLHQIAKGTGETYSIKSFDYTESFILITTLVVCEPIGTPAERNEAAVIAAH